MNSNLLNDRISRLKDWEQTESLGEILYDTFSSLNAYAKNRFDELTHEIRSEYVLNVSAPTVKLAVSTRENADKQIFLHPVATNPPANKPNYITTVFAYCDYPTIQKIMQQTYPAKIMTKTGTLEVQAELKYSSKYLQKIQSLHYTFSENELPWATIDGRYLYKFLDIYSKQEISWDIEGFEIDFAQYDRYISYDKELLWNITRITAPVAQCEAKPAYNAIQYEHTLKKLPLDNDHFLISPFGDRFNSFRRGSELFVRTYEKQLEQIDLIRVIDKDDEDSRLYLPVKSNRKKPGLISTMAKGAYIPTRGEAERIIHSLGETANLHLTDIKTLHCTRENLMRYKGIDYNFFREDNMVQADRKLLLFSLRAGAEAEKVWTHEAMFYILSELQLHFYEYRCVGEII